MQYTFVCFHVAIFFHTVNDFNATEIVTEIAARSTRCEEGIQIFDDDINEAQEEFEVFLTVEGNFTVTYTIQTTVCRIPENDRKLYIAILCRAALQVCHNQSFLSKTLAKFY